MPILSSIKDESSSAIAEKTNQLKQCVEDLAATDEKFKLDRYLLRWLVASSNNVDKAEKAIRTSVEWRRENNIDLLVNKDLPQDIQEKMPLFLDFTHEPPIIYNEMALYDLTKLLQTVGKTRLMEYLIHICVMLEDALRRKDATWTGKLDMIVARQSGVLYICNVAGVPAKYVTSPAVIQFLFEWTKVILNYFPALGSTGVVLNVNRFAKVGIRLIFPLFNGKNVELITCVKGEEYEDEDVQAYVNVDYLKQLREWAQNQPKECFLKF